MEALRPLVDRLINWQIDQWVDIFGFSDCCSDKTRLFLTLGSCGGESGYLLTESTTLVKWEKQSADLSPRRIYFHMFILLVVGLWAGLHTNYQRDFCKTYTEGGSWPQIELINFWCCFLHFVFFIFLLLISQGILHSSCWKENLLRLKQFWMTQGYQLWYWMRLDWIKGHCL